MQRKIKRAVKILRPKEKEARDEGPRLIPLKPPNSSTQHPEKLQHYMNLANVALKLPRDKKRD